MTTHDAYDAAFTALGYDLLMANEWALGGVQDDASYDAAFAAFDALMRYVYPGMTEKWYDRLRERVVHDGWRASEAASGG
jgi:hypothetical protein